MNVMLVFVLKIYFRTLIACWSSFGIGRELLSYLSLRPVYFAFNHVALFLDNIFFPGFRRITIEKPIFLIGHPRSGTTFLHQLLSQTGDFATFKFWEILFPSLVARKVLAPVIRWMIRRKKDTVFPKEVGHEMRLDSVEEEELLFFHNLNTQFVTLSTPLGFGDWDFTELVFSDKQPCRIRKKTMKFLKQCLQRQIYHTGKKQIITNMNYAGMRIESLLETFPDARIIYIVRSPYETMPSHLSLHRNMFDYMYGIENIPPERLRRYYQRRYKYNVEFYKYVEELIEKGILNSSCFTTISYDLLKHNLKKAVTLIVEFTELAISEDLQEKIDQQALRQQNYRRKHRNLELKDFGVSNEEVARDLGFVFDKYGFQR